MPTVNFSPIFNHQVVDSSGNPASGWKVYSYVAGSSTPLATYTDNTGGTSQSNPVVLNSLGFPTTGQIWLAAGSSYKLTLTTDADVVQKTEDNIEGVNDTATLTSSEWVASGMTPTYLSGTSFSVTGDQTSILHVGRRIKSTNTGGSIYSTITASVYGSVTTVTLENDSSTLDAGLSIFWYGLVSAASGSLPVRRDVIPAIADVTDPTKRLRIDVANILTGTTVVAATGAGTILPAGLIFPYAGSSAPTGWLDCDGSAVSRTTYAALFAAISTTWGTGNGSTTFNVPDLRGRTTIGSGTGTTTESVTDASINTGTDAITVTSNDTKWITGMLVTWTVTGTPPTTNPANLLDNNDTVYVVRTNATTISFATSLANAMAGTVIDITAAGSGTFTLTHTYTARTLGQYGGEEGHSQSATELALHTHTWSGSESAALSTGTTGAIANSAAGNSGDAAVTLSGTNASTGSNAAANIMQPFAVLKYIISY